MRVEGRGSSRVSDRVAGEVAPRKAKDRFRDSDRESDRVAGEVAPRKANGSIS